MLLSREKIKAVFSRWNQAWNDHDLDRVMVLFHEEILFENWTGARIRGKEALRKAWRSWFEDHGGFRFIEEDTFIDETDQKILFRWKLEWPSLESGFQGRPEVRRGVDVIHFRDGKIIEKRTYSKTTLEIDGERVPLTAGSETKTGHKTPRQSHSSLT